ncbi:helix-turn-helix domain-containing protein [Streptomyces sp. NPDC088732]|uniref:helix-turn-helix domain-containing protein n=1 Tax=Streptomyces sp. NPDC088732 TaxID=3365879 RepID=UPI00380EA83E
MNVSRVDRRAGSAQGHRTAIEYENSLSLTAMQTHHAEQFFTAWSRGPFSHLSKLAIPSAPAPRGFNLKARGHLVDGMLSARVYSDALTGTSGSHLDEDPIVTNVVTSGWAEFESGRQKHLVGPGQICIRDTKASWSFSCAPATIGHVVSLPRRLVIPHISSPRVLNQGHMAEADTPEVRLLTCFLQGIANNTDDFAESAATRTMARDACAMLLAGIVSQRPGQASEHRSVLLRAAKEVVENNLENPDLSPRFIARKVGVSLRTLHRYFAEANESAMEFVRLRRVQKAHDELLGHGDVIRLSDISARMCYSDVSHFIRHFKSVYGATPAAYVKEFRKAGSA